MKNSDTEQRRLLSVKQAMEKGEIGREPVTEGKRQGKFSKAEALRLYRQLADKLKEETLRNLVENTPENYVLVTDNITIQQMRTDIESSEIIAIDYETLGEEGGALDQW